MRVVLWCAAVAVVVACWWDVVFPPAPRPEHCWTMRMQNSDTFKACGDHVNIARDPNTGYNIVEVRDYDERVLGTYLWVYTLKETR